METLLKTPKAVLQARESQKGLHWALEIAVFFVLFIICSVSEVLVMLPVETAMLMGNQDYLDAAAAGDAERIAEAIMASSGKDLTVIMSLFATGIMILLVILFCRLIQKRKITSLGFVKKGWPMEYLKGIAAGFGLFSAAVLICVLMGAIRLEYTSNTFSLPVFGLFTAGFMVQGMAEEVLCRGYFMVSLARRYSITAAVIVNAAAFAALHLLNPGISLLAVVNLTLFGIFASVCFIKTENIWLVGALHSVWNLVQGNVYGIKVSGMETSCTVFSSAMTEGMELLNGGDFGLEGGLAVTIVFMAGTAFFLFYKNKKDLAVE
ncbi:MAG: CPBP family intramembrane metalloprotease [Eubacterium sp.]|jgi:membrane protease YdiL (CAAX protease family)|nr:CPBP family intramembrane metalloprotease [Eubacterium sp.]